MVKVGTCEFCANDEPEKCIGSRPAPPGCFGGFVCRGSLRRRSEFVDSFPESENFTRAVEEARRAAQTQA